MPTYWYDQTKSFSQNCMTIRCGIMYVMYALSNKLN